MPSSQPIRLHRSALRPHLLVALAIGALLALVAGCSSDSGGGDSDSNGSTTTTSAAADPTGDVDEAADAGRVVAIGEEYLLADLLTLGVTPIASTATVGDQGFQGVDEFDVEGVEALPATEANLERLASLQPDHIVVLQFFADEVGLDKLQGIAETVTVVPDGLDPVAQVEFLGEAFDRQEQAAAAVAEYEAALDASKGTLDGQDISVAAIYGGPSIAAFVAGPWAVPAALLEAGATLVPSPEGLEVDQNGRVYLSLERIDLLAGSTLVLLTAPEVDGESEAIAQVEANPLWATLPAVTADAVIELDRLGYPGIAGRTRLAEELVERLG